VNRAFSRSEPAGALIPGKKERKKDYFFRGGGMIGLEFTFSSIFGFLGFIPLLKLDLLSFFPVYFAYFVLPFHLLLRSQVYSSQVLACFFLFP